MNISETYKDKILLSNIAKTYNDFLDKHWEELSLSIKTYNPLQDKSIKDKWVTFEARVRRMGEDVTDLIPAQGFKWDIHYTKKNYTNFITNKKIIKIEPNAIIDKVKVSFALVKMGSECELNEYINDGKKS